jgi:hypothetical protein
MNSVDEKRANRFRFLHALYEKTDGSREKYLPAEEVGKELGFDRDQSLSIVEYLVGEHLVTYVTMGPTVSLTHLGVREVERALSNPDQPTHFFPPVVNIMHVHTMVNSQVQQGSHGSTQNVSITQSQVADLRSFVNELKQRLPELHLSAHARSVAEADIGTIEAQLASPTPKRGILKESLASVRTIMEGAAGSLVASDLIPKLLPLLTSLT